MKKIMFAKEILFYSCLVMCSDSAQTDIFWSCIFLSRSQSTYYNSEYCSHAEDGILL